MQNATRDLFKVSNIESISNSSLRRTAQNRLLQGGLPDAAIKKKTRRISESTDLAYAESKLLYEKKMSDALYGESNGAQAMASCSRKELSLSSSNKMPTPVTFANCDNCSVTINYNFQQ